MLPSKNRIATLLLAATLAAPIWATDPPADPPAKPADPAKTAAAASPAAPELTDLKAILEQQKKQIEQLKTALEAQQKLIEQYAGAPAPNASAAPAQPAQPAPAPDAKTVPRIPVVASTTPMLPPPAAPAPKVSPLALPPQDNAVGSAPLSLKIGDSYLTPIGFMDMTGVFRSASSGSGIGTSFGSIPFNNVPAARLTETRLNIQNSRIGARFDSNFHGAKILGYWESDFLGTSGSNNLSVSNNAWVFRLRLFYLDVKKGQWEIMGGQSWSMLTPGRNGISPVPGDIFYTQDVDVNYNAGLVWNRSDGFRFVYHPSSTFAAGIALENAEQYIGGSSGGGTAAFPSNSNIATNYANQLDAQQNATITPNVHPDIIAKLAWDPKGKTTHQHIELAGLYSTFKVFNPATNAPTGQSFTSSGGGVALNMNFEPVHNFHLILNNFYSDGGGRYLFGQMPDLAIRGDGSISPIHSYAGLYGFEKTFAPKANPSHSVLLYGYYGIWGSGKDSIIDGAGKLAGWGYTGASSGQDRTIQEPTFGLNQTIWKDNKYGAINLMLQYSYITRSPWYVAPGSPKNAHNSTVFINLRYTLPPNGAVDPAASK